MTGNEILGRHALERVGDTRHIFDVQSENGDSMQLISP